MKSSYILILSAAVLATVALPPALRAQVPAPGAPPAAVSDPDLREIERKTLTKQYENAAKELAVAEKAVVLASTPEQKTAASATADKHRKWMDELKARLAQAEPRNNPKAAVQPAARVEEDVAFFEKKYQKKITGVKPKSEYSDPDEFYEAIGKQLGIPEIAWQAAAAKFGWKKDDGKHTFPMLKGGPTAGAGQGTWDVMFIRSKINPETKKPDPATMEQVMVQIDYDGNIKFPEIPKGNR